jgi:hypothetical protein
MTTTITEQSMTTQHYEIGCWTETTFLDDAWPTADGSDGDAVHESLGYEHHTGIGDDANASTLTVYRRDEPPRFIVEFSSGNIWDAMTAGTLPDALDLLARYVPIVTASEIASAISDIRSLESYGTVTDILAAARAVPAGPGRARAAGRTGLVRGRVGV